MLLVQLPRGPSPVGQRLHRARLPEPVDPAVERGPSDAEAVRDLVIGAPSSQVGLDGTLSQLLRVCSRHLRGKAASVAKTSRLGRHLQNPRINPWARRCQSPSRASTAEMSPRLRPRLGQVLTSFSGNAGMSRSSSRIT